MVVWWYAGTDAVNRVLKADNKPSYEHRHTIRSSFRSAIRVLHLLPPYNRPPVRDSLSTGIPPYQHDFSSFSLCSRQTILVPIYSSPLICFYKLLKSCCGVTGLPRWLPIEIMVVWWYADTDASPFITFHKLLKLWWYGGMLVRTQVRSSLFINY